MHALKFLSALLLATALSLANEAPKELEVKVIKKPENCDKSPKATTGDFIKVHYTGWIFSTGDKFDTSRNGEPLDITLGVGHVIAGWDQGIQGMCLHERRLLKIPSDMGYGSRGYGDVIPPNAALLFDVELVELHPRTESPPVHAEQSHQEL